MRSLARTLLTFWLRPTAAEPLALFRMCLGAALFVSALVTLGPRMSRDFGPAGEVPAAALGDWPQRSQRFSLFLLPGSAPDDLSQARVLFVAWLAALLCLTVGLATRVAAFTSWLLTLSFHTRLDWLLNGGDAVLRLGLFYLLLLPSGRVWSLDRWWIERRGWRSVWPASSVVLRWRQGLAARMGWGQPGATDVPPWTLRLAQVQLVTIYFFAGLLKVTGGYPRDGQDLGAAWRTGDLPTLARGLGHAVAGQDWLNGEAVYWVLNDVTLNRMPYFALPVPLFLCRLVSWATLLFEIGFPFLALSRRLRPRLLLAGLLFHVGILVHTEIGWFGPAMLCWYPLLLSRAQAIWLARSALRVMGGPGLASAVFKTADKKEPPEPER
jgi:hypothetical protein